MKRKLSFKMELLSWILQLVSAVILGFAGYSKLTGAPQSILIFDTLEMGAIGRVLIGLLEVLAVILLVQRSTRVWGAILSFSIMIGASIAHITVLGFDELAILLIVVLMSSLGLMFIHRRRLPLIAHTLD